MGEQRKDVEAFISSMEELQKVISDAGKSELLWTVFGDLMCVASDIWHNEEEKRAEKKEGWKILEGGKGSIGEV